MVNASYDEIFNDGVGKEKLPPPTDENALLLSKADGTPSPTSSGPLKKLTEADHISNIERLNTNYVFMFGGATRGKTVITSSIINFLSSTEANGDLSPFAVKEQDDHGNALLKKILRVFSERRFPDRTVLVGDNEPIYVNVVFTPHDRRNKSELHFTFLEMPGDELQRIDVPTGGRGELPQNINVFFKANKVSLSFILVTDWESAHEDDQLLATFIDFVRQENKDLPNKRFLLLITKWDTYDAGLSVAEFVRKNMRLTDSKLADKQHSIAEYSIGSVAMVDGKPYMKEYNPIPAKKVINWLYENISGKKLYEKSGWQKLRDFFYRFS